MSTQTSPDRAALIAQARDLLADLPAFLVDLIIAEQATSRADAEAERLAMANDQARDRARAQVQAGEYVGAAIDARWTAENAYRDACATLRAAGQVEHERCQYVDAVVRGARSILREAIESRQAG